MDHEVDVYDYAIVGRGLSGLLMAYRMVMDGRFADKRIVIFEDDKKKENDRTWCYWEEGEGEWDHLLTHSWTSAKVKSRSDTQVIDMDQYRYKMLRSQDFYRFIENELARHPQVIHRNERVNKLTEQADCVRIDTDVSTYHSNYILTSVMGLNDTPVANHELMLHQHFGGWFVATERAVFQPNEVVLMDFSVEQTDGVCFMYVLPMSTQTALVEFTVFGPNQWPMETYEAHLRTYLETLPTSYTIVEREMGSIPMTVYPFEKNNSRRIHGIGTAGGWTRASTGYTFANGCRYSKRLTEALASQRRAPAVWAHRHRLYDAVMLSLIAEHPHLGVEFFMHIYRDHPIARVFRFLDGSSTVMEEALIIGKSRPKMLLIRYVMRRLLGFGA